MKDQEENNLKESPAVTDKEVSNTTNITTVDTSTPKEEEKNVIKRARDDEKEETNDVEAGTSAVIKKPRIESEAEIETKNLNKTTQEEKNVQDAASGASEGESKGEGEGEHKNKDVEVLEKKSTNERETSKEPSEPEKTKFIFGAPAVFGSTTKFGSGFKLAASKSAKSGSSSSSSSSGEASKEKQIDSKFGTGTSAGTFGSGFSFGTGFGVLKQLKNKEKKSEEQDGQEPAEKLPEGSICSSASLGSTPNEHTQLHMQEVESGEELEECLYQTNAKLYYLSDIKVGWKERGVGTVKVNKDKKTNKARLVMRSRGILKVILNLPLVKEFTIHEGFPGSLYSEKFIRIIAVDENNEPITYALKTGKEEIAKELYKCIMSTIPK